MNDLNAQVLAAHATGNKPALVGLYTQAANAAPNPQAAQFFLTHAYVFALDTGHADADTLRLRLGLTPLADQPVSRS